MRYQLFQFSLSILELLQLFFYDSVFSISCLKYVPNSKASFSFFMKIFVDFVMVKAEMT